MDRHELESGVVTLVLTLTPGSSNSLQGAIREGLLPAWDLATDKPGRLLEKGGVKVLKTALQSLLGKGGPLEEVQGTGYRVHAPGCMAMV